MGLFGGIKDVLSGINKPGDNGTSFVERLGALGAVMQGENDAMLKMLELGKGRTKEAQRAKALAALSDALGPQYAVDNAPIVQRTERTPVPELNELNMPGLSPRPEAPAPYTYQPPQRLPQRTLNDPNLQQALISATLGGIPGVGDIVSLLDKTRPQIRTERGFAFDERDPSNVGRYFPDLKDGQEPLYDGKGNVIAVRNLDGSVEAAAQRAGAIKAAESQAQAPYQFQTFQGPEGEPVTASVADMAGRTFRGQRPTDRIASEAAATAQAATRADLPRLTAQADQTISVIDALLANPDLEKRTGAYAVLPAIPGTGGAGFDALHDQLTGKVFMEAFSTLKGGGQITEKEGQKATAAFARLNRAQSPKDYRAALMELREVVAAGVNRARASAGGGRRASAPDRSAVEAELRRRGLIR